MNSQSYCSWTHRGATLCSQGFVAALVRFVVHINAQYDFRSLGPRPRSPLALNNLPLFDPCERSPQWIVSMVTSLPSAKYAPIRCSRPPGVLSLARDQAHLTQSDAVAPGGISANPWGLAVSVNQGRAPPRLPEAASPIINPPSARLYRSETPRAGIGTGSKACRPRRSRPPWSIVEPRGLSEWLEHKFIRDALVSVLARAQVHPGRFG
jgi:hypothetical protein